MHTLQDLMRQHPFVPYIRHSDYAVRKPWYVPVRRLLDYLLIYVQEGECVFSADGVTHTFASGDFCLIQPNSLHELRGLTDTITPYAHLDIWYNPNREQSFMTVAGQTDLSPYTHLLQPRLNDIEGISVPVKFMPKRPIEFRDKLLDLVKCWHSADPLLQLEAQTLASQLMLTLLQDFSLTTPQTQAAMPSFNWITSYFTFQLGEPLSVDDMAKRANLSSSRFRDVFKRQFGMPPHRYLLELRIQHAKAMLATTGLTLAEIAAYCGFADVHHFAKAFKSRVGETPGGYRTSHAAQPRAGGPN